MRRWRGTPPRPEPQVVRTFRAPNGREWSVSEFDVPAGFCARTGDGGIVTTLVLRFESKNLTLDCRRFPKDWPDLSEDALIQLLRLAGTPCFVPLVDSAEHMGMH